MGNPKESQDRTTRDSNDLKLLAQDSAPTTFSTQAGSVHTAKQPSAKARPKTAADIDDLAFLDPPLDAGEVGWFGSYRVLRLHGKGGMGLVFLAEDPRLQRQVALKVMRPDLAGNDVARQRFLCEARAMATIQSDHVVKVFEIGQCQDLPYLAAEFLKGMPLDDWLPENRNPSLDTVLDFGLQIARGLAAAHTAGIIHRDIKPANLWVEPDGRLKILDFGLARMSQENVALTQAGTVLGTPAYMAPEQADGRPIDARCDLFSLGCVLYELATGTKPFDGANAVVVLKAVALHEPTPPQDRNAALPPVFTDLVLWLLAKNPEDRPASAADVIAELDAIAAQISRPKPAKRPLSTQRRIAVKPRSRRRFYLVAAALALVGVLAVLASLGTFTFGDPAHPAAAAANRATAQGVTDQEIVLGMSSVFSGPARELGHQMEVGIGVYFDHINEQGGVAGRKLRLVALDDGYEPERALANMKALDERHKVLAVIGNVGTPTAETAMPYALSKQMIFFGAFSGANLLRKEPPDRYVFNYRASYAEETAAAVKYLIESKGLRPEEIAVFAQQDGYGDAGFNGVVKMLRKYGRRVQDIVRVGHLRNSLDIAAAVKEILQHKEIRAVITVSTYRQVSKLVYQLKDAKADPVIASVSFVGADALAEELRQLGPDYVAGVIVTQVVPHPLSQASVVLQYRDLLRKYHSHEKPSFGSLEGYLDAVLFVEGLRRAGDNLTNETLVEALESIRNLDIGLGSPLQFGPSEHQASHKVWGTILDRSGSFQILDLE